MRIGSSLNSPLKLHFFDGEDVGEGGDGRDKLGAAELRRCLNRQQRVVAVLLVLALGAADLKVRDLERALAQGLEP